MWLPFWRKTEGGLFRKGRLLSVTCGLQRLCAERRILQSDGDTAQEVTVIPTELELGQNNDCQNDGSFQRSRLIWFWQVEPAAKRLF